jgi:S-adenosylmethionine/arginine decarboxylase-like enzyme
MSSSAGLHIVMDARVSDPSVFTREKLTQMFENVVKALDMKPLDDVQVYEVPVDPDVLERVKLTGQFEDEGGISTIQVISTSHLSLHAWPLQRYFALDAFSCKEYDAEKALSIVRKMLGVVSENTVVIKRRKPHEASQDRNVKLYEV